MGVVMIRVRRSATLINIPGIATRPIKPPESKREVHQISYTQDRFWNLEVVIRSKFERRDN